MVLLLSSIKHKFRRNLLHGIFNKLCGKNHPITFADPGTMTREDISSLIVGDFNSNLVIRWEYDPGSTLFLVWSQSRFDYLNDGEFRLGDDLDGLFGTHPHDVFLVKFNRWFSL